MSNAHAQPFTTKRVPEAAARARGANMLLRLVSTVTITDVFLEFFPTCLCLRNPVNTGPITISPFARRPSHNRRTPPTQDYARPSNTDQVSWQFRATSWRIICTEG